MSLLFTIEICVLVWPAYVQSLRFHQMRNCVIGDRVGEGFTKLSPDLPAGIVWFLLVDTLPCALGLNGFKITVVYPQVKLVALGISDVRKGGYIQVQTAPIDPLDLNWFPFGISKDHIHEVLIMMPLKIGNSWVI